ncbi:MULTISPECIES: HemK2/MTQ2 family protein methyltransferase [unclassified Streptomyces]|uniref:HemK2/MTQ2 family protein methyltransferase n=1 Tax=unclassified Streptomyces TaxID=2593676 RepID=UPI0036E62853
MTTRLGARPAFTAKGPRLLTPHGVYAPQYDTDLLTRALQSEPISGQTDVLDLGTGSGALAVIAARMGARVTAVDISWRAVWTARLNALLNHASITVRRADLSVACKANAFNLVVSNPPYVPAPAGQQPVRGVARAWDGGVDGRSLVNRVCDAAHRALRPGGRLLMVHSEMCGSAESIDRLTGLGMSAAVIDKAQVPFGPVLQEYRVWLCAQGLLDEGTATEGLVVIRAEQP